MSKNFIFYGSFRVVNAIATAVPNSIKTYSDDWCSTAVCGAPTEFCYFGECENCNAAKSFQTVVLTDEEKDLQVSLSQWQKQHNEILKADQFIKVTVKQSVGALFNVSQKFCYL
jgi:cold shock CspA family protein